MEATRPHSVPDAGEPHTSDNLKMTRTDDGFRLLEHPREDRRVLAYVIEHPKKAYSRTIVTEAGARSVTQHQFERRFRPRLSPLSVSRKWHRRMEVAMGDRSAMRALLTMLGMELPGYEPQRPGEKSVRVPAGRVAA